jgi:predicted  nucleic acid-binding Zn-ribbon protein
LKSERIATAEAKASVAALRRLAFRLAVSISVKENRIANAARQLASSRKHDYVAEKKIQALQESLQEEERRSRDILQTLERASALAVQCA